MWKVPESSDLLRRLSPALEKETAALPAFAIAGEVNRVLAAGNRLVITAPPGAGKSTVLPLTLLEALPEGKILMLEPRRVAARQIAERMACLLGEPVGQTVGYRVRFESKVSRHTRIEVLTEGILTRMLVEDPALEGVGLVLFDEFHERSLVCDEALALTRQCQSILREDLRLVVMSATIDTTAIAQALEAPVVESQGKLFPVEIRRSAKEADASNVAELVAHTLREAHARESGDILAILPGEAEIRRCAELLGTALGATHICPLYGQLSNAAQKAAIAPSRPGERKVVLATPIAETSLTIQGVRVVVDGGLCKRLVVDPRSGLSRLETVRISLDMATQRSGRAGRLEPGVCYRLWSAATEARMAPVRMPEILSADLCSLVLDVAAWGEQDLLALPWITLPPASSVLEAKRLLTSLRALDAQGRLTPHGKALAAMPCHPRVAQMLLEADTPQRKALAADLAAVLEEKDPLPEESGAGIDLRLTALRRARKGQDGRWGRILRMAEQYAAMAHTAVENTPTDPYEAGALLAKAYPERIGRAWKEGGPGRFVLSGGGQVAVETADPLAACEWLAVAAMADRPGGVGRIFLAAPLAPEDLFPLSTTRDVVLWDRSAGCAVARRERRVGNHLLESRPLSEGVREQLTAVIVEAAQKEGASLFDFSHPDVQGLQRRIAAVRAWHPELELPDVSTEALLERAAEWVPLYIGKATSVAQFKKIDLCAVLWGLLTYAQQQAVDRLAPVAVTVPTGSHIRLEYRTGAEAPVLRVRLQECFGLVDTPRVDGGCRPVLMELLSPGYKPVQLTSDLASFWSGTYFEVRKELRRRYPKHDWPDNPLEADPVRGIRKK